MFDTEHTALGVFMAKEKILIIEDNPDIAAMVSDMIRERGYRSVIAYDGLTGLDFALQEQPDLILLDLRLPQMSGVELLSRIQAHKLDLPVVVMTALGSEELALHALRMGVKDYVKKPFAMPELLQVIERALQEARLRRERDRLTAQLMTSNQQLKSLYEVGQALISTVNLDEQLNVVLKEVCRALDVRLTSVFLVDQPTGDLVFRLGTGDRADRLIGQRLEAGQGIAGWVAQHGEPLLVRRAQQDPRFRRAFDQITGFATKSILCVPLTVKGRVIGVIQASNKAQPGFTEDDMVLLRSLATSAALAIDNARLYQNLRDSRDQLAQRSADLKKVLKKLVRLQRIALALSTLTIGADLRDAYKRLTEYAAMLLEVKRSAILLFYPERRELVCQEPAFGMTADIVRGYRIPLGPDSPIWDAWENGQSLVINDLAASPLLEALKLTDQTKHGDVHSTMFSTMRIGGRSTGLFQVSDKQDGSDFSVDDERILEIFASQSAIAIENARSLDRV